MAIPASTQETIYGVRDRTGVSYMQGRHLIAVLSLQFAITLLTTIFAQKIVAYTGKYLLLLLITFIQHLYPLPQSGTFFPLRKASR